MTHPALQAILLAAALVGCERAKEAPTGPRGEFGVLFGGQIQERRDIPFELDRTKQVQGFRVELPAPLTRDVLLTWQVDRPRGPSPATKNPLAEPAEPAPPKAPPSAVLRAGETRFEHAIPFEPGDPLGMWNIRVVLDAKVVIDRPFEVYDARQRERASRDAGR